jgi:hypothetical protein
MISWILIVLTHWINSPRINMALYADTLSWFRHNRQSLLFLRNTACLAEKQNYTNVVVFRFTRPELEPAICHTRGEYAINYTTNVCYLYIDDAYLLLLVSVSWLKTKRVKEVPVITILISYLYIYIKPVGHFVLLPQKD